MLGLPFKLHHRCRTTLLKCSEFDSDATLRAVFAISELRPFRYRLPEASNRSERVNACLEFLPDQHLNDGRAVLPIFLDALCNRYQLGDALRDELQALCENIQAVVAQTETQPTPAPHYEQQQLEERWNDLLEAYRRQVANKIKATVGKKFIPSITFDRTSIIA